MNIFLHKDVYLVCVNQQGCADNMADVKAEMWRNRGASVWVFGRKGIGCFP